MPVIVAPDHNGDVQELLRILPVQVLFSVKPDVLNSLQLSSPWFQNPVRLREGCATFEDQVHSVFIMEDATEISFHEMAII